MDDVIDWMESELESHNKYIESMLVRGRFVHEADFEFRDQLEKAIRLLKEVN
jgi:hypothetical protein